MLHRLICWAIEYSQHAQQIGGLRLYNLRYDEDARPADVMRAATEYLDRADQGFRTLVHTEIRMVVASSFQESIYPSTGAYFTKFQKWEGGSPLFLASRLVWVAEYIRRARNGSADETVRRRECTRTQLAFLDSVGEDATWIASLRKHAD
jgi:hypothetical protein